jgi:ATP-binding cassette subfamily B protein
MNNNVKPQNIENKRNQGVFVILKPYKGLVFLLILVALLSNSVMLIIPKIISTTIDAFTSGNYVVTTLILEFSIASVIIFVLTYFQGILQTYVSERVAKDLRTQLSEKISQQNYSYIIKANPSKLLTNLTSDIDAIKMFVSQAVSTIVSSLFVIIAISVLLILLNWKLALSVLGIIPIISGTFFFVLSKVRLMFKKSREIIDRLNKIINESIMGAPLIRVVNSQHIEYNKFLEANTEARNLGISILRMFALLIPVIVFVASLAMIVILALGGQFVVQGSMSLGNFAAFYSYLALLIFPILMIGFMSNIIAQATTSYNRINGIIETPEVVETGTIKENIRGDILLNDVSLSLGDKPVLKNISFSVHGSSRTAVIGPTAAGKSQLLFLLTNLIKPDNGLITFDGRTIDEYNRDSFYNQIGFVFQDSVIFNMSIRDNIAFSGDISDEALQKAIETAELKDFIETLPEKLDTVVSERGSNLSGGQKQRIMLARALSINPKVLLLDDFTARVDRKTEQKILCNLENNYPDLTLISVTQKVAPVKHFEKIILLMEGELIASGSHKELMGTCPEYVQVYNSQRSTSHYEL